MAKALSIGPATAAPTVARRSAVRWLSYAFFVAALLFAAVAAALGDVFFFRLATESLIFGGLALSVDLLLGRTGLLPLGQALFFGFGAYVSALTLKHLAPSLPLALAVVLASCTLVGLIVSPARVAHTQQVDEVNHLATRGVLACVGPHGVLAAVDRDRLGLGGNAVRNVLLTIAQQVLVRHKEVPIALDSGCQRRAHHQ